MMMLMLMIIIIIIVYSLLQYRASGNLTKKKSLNPKSIVNDIVLI